MNISHGDTPGINLLLPMASGELVNIARHALRMNTQILEADTASLKFVQVMMLLEYLTNPFDYTAFKRKKGNLIAVLTGDRKEYYELAEEFKYYAQEIRTELIHNGKRFEELVSDESEIKKTFQRLQGFLRTLIEDLFWNLHISWSEYDANREQKKNIIVGIAGDSTSN